MSQPGRNPTMIFASRRRFVAAALAAALLGTAGLRSARLTANPLPPQASPSASVPKVQAQESEPHFKLQVERNEVQVRVVVRDAHGNAVGNLSKADFILFDDGKQQTISHFTVEGPALGQPAHEPATTFGTSAGGTQKAVSQPPARYLALYFDDVHLDFDDIVHTRDAAQRYLSGTLQSADRVAIFTSSGQGGLDFTEDRARLKEALSKIIPRPIVQKGISSCPAISNYQAYLITERRDPTATDLATEEAFECNCTTLAAPNQSYCRNLMRSAAISKANRVEQDYLMESESSLRGIRQIIRRMSILPGQRNLVFVSPGFLTLTIENELDDITDQALRSNVVINTLDSRGLYAPVPIADATQPVVFIPNRPDLMTEKAQIARDSLEQRLDVMNALAVDTGGVFFQNSSDFDRGFRAVGALPSVYYVLGFSPASLNRPGKFHTLEVKLANPAGLTLQARRGYFEPIKAKDEAAQAQEDIRQAVFSQDDMNEIPIQVHTQFFRAGALDDKLSVLTNVDLRFVHFRKEAGLNCDQLTLVTVLFDRNGKYLKGTQKTLILRLRDETLARLLPSGVTMKSSFDVAPGSYMVRQVVRDPQGATISGLSRDVDVPF